MLSKRQVIILHEWRMLKVNQVFTSDNSKTRYIVTDKGDHFVQFKEIDGNASHLYCMPLDANDYQMFPFTLDTTKGDWLDE